MPQANAVINTRMKPELKKEFERIVSGLGLTTSAAINLFAAAVVRNQGIPFELTLKTSNEKTLQAMDDAVNGRNLAGPFESVEEAMKYLNDET